MVLDIDLFREEKGGDPNRIRENAKKRFDDVNAVEEVINLGKCRWLVDLPKSCLNHVLFDDHPALYTPQINNGDRWDSIWIS